MTMRLVFNFLCKLIGRLSFFNPVFLIVFISFQIAVAQVDWEPTLRTPPIICQLLLEVVRRNDRQRDVIYDVVEVNLTPVKDRDESWGTDSVALMNKNGKRIAFLNYSVTGTEIQVFWRRTNDRYSGRKAQTYLTAYLLSLFPNTLTFSGELAADNEAKFKKGVLAGKRPVDAFRETSAYKILSRLGYSRILQLISPADDKSLVSYRLGKDNFPN